MHVHSIVQCTFVPAISHQIAGELDYQGGGGAVLIVTVKFSNTVGVDVVSCHGHGRANFRLCMDRVFTTRPGCLTRCDVDVTIHVFLTLIFFHTTMRLHASCVCTETPTWCLCKVGHVDRQRAQNTSTSTVLLNLAIIIT